jgi:hypothetical protein
MKTHCSEKDALLLSFKAAVHEYSEAITKLDEQMDYMSGVEYEDLKRFAEDARARAMHVKRRMEFHLNEHGC